MKKSVLLILFSFLLICCSDSNSPFDSRLSLYYKKITFDQLAEEYKNNIIEKPTEFNIDAAVYFYENNKHYIFYKNNKIDYYVLDDEIRNQNSEVLIISMNQKYSALVGPLQCILHKESEKLIGIIPGV